MMARIIATYAAVSYAANCALGLAVASGRLRTGRARWVHHTLYINTAASTAAATVALVAERGRAGAVVAPALAPLAAIPYAGTRGWRHPALAVSIAPFIVAGLVVAWRRPAATRTSGTRTTRRTRTTGRRRAR
ncbi:MAG TPA: hypothetical protein VFN04_04395 [Protaetiibacter sp.]|nr:hypothetical protein [Protaetiibacter sp.]